MAALEGIQAAVLIVEDVADTARLMQITLERLGLTADWAPDGMSALAYLADKTPDLMILDLGMPDIHGWTVLEHVKSGLPTTDYPVIVLTAFDDPANKLIGKLQSRVYRYLTKPFDPRTLSDTVIAALMTRLERTA